MHACVRVVGGGGGGGKHLGANALHASSSPDLHHVVPHSLDLLQVAAHLVIQLRMPVSYPARRKTRRSDPAVHDNPW